MFDNADNDTKAFYYALWYDCLERLDIVLLEARHLQQNFIYSLREPILYRPLRFEEKFLWGHCFFDFFKENNKDNFERISRECIIPYPDKFQDMDRVESFNFIPGQDGIEFTCIVSSILRKINESMSTNLWSYEQKKVYNCLRNVQTIKVNIFYDRLMLCYYGGCAFVNFLDDTASFRDGVAKLMLLRRAIVEKSNVYVTRLSEYHDLFSKNYDAGVLDSPRPSLSRRREQIVYNTYLSNRCNQRFKEMQMLLIQLGVSIDTSSNDKVSHNWTQDIISSQTTFFNHLSKNSSDSKFLFFIKTSYWMPERPDMQNIISHEVAHAVIDNNLQKLSESYLQNGDDHFSICMRCIYRQIEVAKYINPDYLIKEIAADILAVTVSGPSYLYALFVEIFGFGLERFFDMSGNIKLDLVDYLDGVSGHLDLDKQWYLRINIICFWLKEICLETDDNNLLLRMIASIQSICDNMLVYLDDISFPGAVSSHIWHELKNRIFSALSLQVYFKKISSEFYKNYKTNYYKYDKKLRRYVWGRRDLAKSYYALPILVRNYLALFLFKKKIILNGIVGSNLILNHAWDVYKLRFDYDILGNDFESVQCPFIFKFLQDIPWQCIFLRGLDATHPKSIFRKITLPSFISNTFSCGSSSREIYHVALDFHLAVTESASTRLAEVIRLIINLPNPLFHDVIYDGVVFEFYKWLYGCNWPYDLVLIIKKVLVELKLFPLFEVTLKFFVNNVNILLSKVEQVIKNESRERHLCVLKFIVQLLAFARKDEAILTIFIELLTCGERFIVDKFFSMYLLFSYQTKSARSSSYNYLKFLFVEYYNLNLKISSIRLRQEMGVKYSRVDLDIIKVDAKCEEIAANFSALELMFSFGLFEYMFNEKRILERAHGKKIKYIHKKIKFFLNDAHISEYYGHLLSPVVSYAAIRRSKDADTPYGHNRRFYSLILKSFSDLEQKTSDELNPLVLLGRLSTSADHYGIDRKMYASNPPSANFYTDYIRILGRFDYFIMNRQPNPLGRCDLITISPPMSNSGEYFAPFFCSMGICQKNFFKQYQTLPK